MYKTITRLKPSHQVFKEMYQSKKPPCLQLNLNKQTKLYKGTLPALIGTSLQFIKLNQSRIRFWMKEDLISTLTNENNLKKLKTDLKVIRVHSFIIKHQERLQYNRHQKYPIWSLHQFVV